MIQIVLLLTCVWVAMSEDGSLQNWVAGFAISLGLVLLGGRDVRLTGKGLPRIHYGLALVLYVFWELCVSNLRVTLLVLRPRVALNPGIVAVPVDFEHDWQTALLANLITLTPGSLTVEVSADSRTLFVHELDASDPDQVRRSIQEGFGRRITRLVP